MLVLGALNAMGVAVFGLIYAAAAKHLLTQGAFLASLALSFVGLTVLWVRTERSRGPARDVLSRAGRIAAGLVLAAMAVPGVILMPLFFINEYVPPEAGIAEILGPVMFILLASLALVALVNVAGVLALGVSAILTWWNCRATE
jgi:hypothetical protein